MLVILLIQLNMVQTHFLFLSFIITESGVLHFSSTVSKTPSAFSHGMSDL